MEAVRCIQCGETRWSLFAGSFSSALQAPCELCGGECVPERRRPGSQPERLAVERRRVVTVGRMKGGAGGPRTRVHAH